MDDYNFSIYNTELIPVSFLDKTNPNFRIYNTNEYLEVVVQPQVEVPIDTIATFDSETDTWILNTDTTLAPNEILTLDGITLVIPIELIFINDGEIDNNGTLTNLGTIINNNEIVNLNGTINNDNQTIFNNGLINNIGGVVNNNNGIINNNNGGIIDGGIINNNGGTITNTI